MNDVVIEFRDTASGELVDVSNVKFDHEHAWHGDARRFDHAANRHARPIARESETRNGGAWMAALSYEGPRGEGQVSFSVNVKL